MPYVMTALRKGGPLCSYLFVRTEGTESSEELLRVITTEKLVICDTLVACTGLTFLEY